VPDRPIRILLVDDDEVDRLSFERMCRSAALPYTVKATASVADAVAALADFRPDVVVTDYNLGDGTAFDLRRQLGDDTPLVIITGAGSQEVAIRAIREGAFDYLVKDTRGEYLRMLPLTIQSAVARASARRQVEMLSQALMSISEAVYIVNSERRILFANGVFKERYDAPSCEGLSIDDVFEELTPQYAPGDELGMGTSAYQGVELRTRSGACSHVLKSTSSVVDSRGRAVATVVVIRDISEIVATGEQLRRYATTDELTNAMSRHFGLLLLEKQMAMAARSGRALTVCYADIDGLKEVNDTYGHQAGDEYITLVTRAMSRPFRVSDSLCRVGGDEFLMILPDCNLDEACRVWRRIGASVAVACRRSGKPQYLGISHGFAQFDPALHQTVDQLIGDADAAMYAEKVRRAAARSEAESSADTPDRRIA
jgi:diguanylate cyclase (GGDEF)-like protein